MRHKVPFTIAILILCGTVPVLAQDPPTQSRQRPGSPASNGTPSVTVDPAQPYRPLPAGRPKQQKTIFEFDFERLNPRKIHWGDEIDRRIANLIDSSIRNPYFRYSAIQTGINIVLVALCWAWWDKLRQTKWIVAEQLTDALNAKRYADHRAADAIAAHNRHMESCNRSIEENGSGLASGRSAAEWQHELLEMQNKLAAERSKVVQMEGEVARRAEMQTQMETRLRQLEQMMQDRREESSAELVARLQRAESQLAERKAPRK